jgi:hypothetical protein
MKRQRLRTAIGPTVLLVALGAIFGERAGAEDRLKLQAGIRIGYVVGQGWSLGPVVSLGQSLGIERAVALGAIIGADLPLGGQPGRALRVHAGQELTVFGTCPVLVAPLSFEVAWAFGGSAPSRLGWQLAASVMTGATNPFPDYYHPAKGPQPLAGGFYRFTRIAEHPERHELGADLRVLVLPHTPDHGIGVCGGN